MAHELWPHNPQHLLEHLKELTSPLMTSSLGVSTFVYLNRYKNVPLARRWGGAVKLFKLMFGRFLEMSSTVKGMLQKEKKDRKNKQTSPWTAELLASPQ